MFNGIITGVEASKKPRTATNSRGAANLMRRLTMPEYTPHLGVRRQAFVEAYLQCLNATQAARQANYRHPNKQGPELLKLPEVVAAIDARLGEMRQGTDARFADAVGRNIERVMDKLSTCADLYLVEAENGLVKIGISGNAQERFAAINGQSPIPLSLVFYCRVSNARALELWLHEAYKDKRVRGEWFSLSRGDIRDISIIAKRRDQK